MLEDSVNISKKHTSEKLNNTCVHQKTFSLNHPHLNPYHLHYQPDSNPPRLCLDHSPCLGVSLLSSPYFLCVVVADQWAAVVIVGGICDLRGWCVGVLVFIPDLTS